MTSFNGAMTSQPWIRLAMNPHFAISAELQWSHDLSAMDTAMLSSAHVLAALLQWSHDLSAMDTPRYSMQFMNSHTSFNGAMTSQPWIPGSGAKWLRCWQSFNGAMTSQPWIRVFLAAMLICRLCFNGAMTSQPWILGSDGDIYRAVVALQWSHDLSAMDTRPR